jgi:hypothetical protein
MLGNSDYCPSIDANINFIACWLFMYHLTQAIKEMEINTGKVQD